MPVFLFFFLAAKSRRQPKPYKPKKMIKLETKTAVYTACNNGSSSIVTKDGELYMFGKDAIYSDSTCELNGRGPFLQPHFLRYISVVSLIIPDQSILQRIFLYNRPQAK